MCRARILQADLCPICGEPDLWRTWFVADRLCWISPRSKLGTQSSDAIVHGVIGRRNDSWIDLSTNFCEGSQETNNEQRTATVSHDRLRSTRNQPESTRIGQNRHSPSSSRCFLINHVARNRQGDKFLWDRPTNDSTNPPRTPTNQGEERKRWPFFDVVKVSAKCGAFEVP
jgi:hypothetical protein